MSQNVGTEAKKEMAIAYLQANTFHLILMKPGFSWDKNNHKVYSDIKNQEVATAFGYTQGGKELLNFSVSSLDGKVEVAFDNVSWPVSGGVISAIGIAIIKWTGVDTSATVYGSIQFSGGQRDEGDGASFDVNNIRLPIS